MQNFLSNKFSVFLFGLITGAALFWVFYIYNQEILTFVGLQKPVVEEIIIEPDTTKEKNQPKKKTKKQKAQEQVQTDSTNANITSDFSTDTSYQSLAIDSNSAEQIVIMKDELIFSKKYKPSGDPVLFQCDFDEKLDSVLIDHKSKSIKDGLLVEFWKSPVNFKGYRLTRNKLVIYGFFDHEAISFTYLENQTLRLTYKEKSFVLRCSEDFIPQNFNSPKN